VFAGGWYRTVVRFDRKTGQIVHVFVPGTRYRSVNNAPMAFSPHDPHSLYYGTQFLMRTRDAGATWQEISPDLTAASNRPVAAGPSQLRSITTFSLSPVNQGVIWAATNNGVVQMTNDGGTTWRDVSPADLPDRGGFEIIEAGRHDEATAYAAYIVANDLHPYIYRTRDAGTSWERIVQGLPDTAFVRVVREDPVRSGLLYCGTESGVFVSVDAGDHWQSLQLNLPASSMRDLVVHGDDLVLATYGRALWILDNVTPLRQLAGESAASETKLLAPAAAIRARFDVNNDTPLPVETPTAPNPPEGAVIDYYLKGPPDADLTLTITDDRGQVVRTFSSVAPPAPSTLANVPDYWFAPPSVLTRNTGLNRFAWDLRHPAPRILPFGYSGALLPYVEYTLADHAIPGRTPRVQPEGPLVLPGRYTIELSAGTHHERQTLVVSADPRVHASQADLVAQFELASRLVQGLSASFDGYHSLAAFRTTIGERVKSLGDAPSARDRVATLKGFDRQVDAVQNGTTASPGLGAVNREMARLYAMVESGDARPSEPLSTSANEWCGALTKALDAWRRLNADDLTAVNRALKSAKVQALSAVSVPDTPRCLP